MLKSFFDELQKIAAKYDGDKLRNILSRMSDTAFNRAGRKIRTTNLRGQLRPSKQLAPGVAKDMEQAHWTEEAAREGQIPSWFRRQT